MIPDHGIGLHTHSQIEGSYHIVLLHLRCSPFGVSKTFLNDAIVNDRFRDNRVVVCEVIWDLTCLGDES